MYRSDSHNHTVYSSDIPESRPAAVADMCRAAAESGLDYFAVTDHYEQALFKAAEYRFPIEDYYRDILAAREEYRGRMYVAAGIEYGEPYLCPDDIDAATHQIPFDIVLGSVHYLPEITGFLSFPYESVTAQERVALFDKYLDAWDALVHSPGIDVFTHPTYPLRYCLRKNLPFPLSDWEERLRGMFRHIVERGCGLEYNAAHLRVPNNGIPDHTTETVLRWYREAGGEILVFASDAHFREHIAVHHDFCMRVAREIGFRYIAVYKNRKPEFHKIEI